MFTTRYGDIIETQRFVNNYIKAYKRGLEPGQKLSQEELNIAKERALKAITDATERAVKANARQEAAFQKLEDSLVELELVKDELSNIEEELKILNKKISLFKSISSQYTQGAKKSVGTPSFHLDPTLAYSAVIRSDSKSLEGDESSNVNAKDFSGRKRPWFYVFNPAGNSVYNKSDELNPNINNLNYTVAMNNLNLASKKYSMKMVKAFKYFPQDKARFEEAVKDRKYKDKDGNVLDYKWEDVIYGIIVDENGKFVDPNGNIVETTLEEQNKPGAKDIVYTTLSLATTEIFDGKDWRKKYYVPQPGDIEGWRKYLPEELGDKSDEFVVRNAEDILNEKVRKLTAEYEHGLDNINKALTNPEGEEEVIVQMVGKSKGVVKFDDVALGKTNLVERLKEIATVNGETLSDEDIIKSLDIMVATSDRIELPDGSVLPNTIPGHTYVRDKNTGAFYPVDPKNLSKETAKEVLKLMQYYVTRINQILEQYKKEGKTPTMAEVFNKAARLVDASGNEIIKDNEPVSIFRLIADRVYYTGNNMSKDGKPLNTNPKTKFHFNNGNTITFGNRTEIFLVKNEQGQFMLNGVIEDTIEEFLTNRFHQVNNQKLKNNDNTFVINSVDTKKGTISVKEQSYKEYLLKNALMTRMSIPLTHRMEYEGTTKDVVAPLFLNAYPYMSFDKYNKGLAYTPKYTPPPDTGGKIFKPETETKTDLSHITVRMETGPMGTISSTLQNIMSKAGIKNIKFRTAKSLDALDAAQKKTVSESVKKAAKNLNRSQLKEGSDAHNNLMLKELNVRGSDMVIAISDVIEPGQRDKENYMNSTKNQITSNSTAYEVQFAIDNKKPVYVFDQMRGEWFTWNGEKFVETSAPTVGNNTTLAFTKQITEEGINAFKSLFSTPEPVQTAASEGEQIVQKLINMLGGTKEQTKTSTESTAEGMEIVNRLIASFGNQPSAFESSGTQENIPFSEKDIPLDPLSGGNEAEPPFRKVSSENYKKADISKEEQWFRDRFNVTPAEQSVSYDTVNTMIKTGTITYTNEDYAKC